MTWSQVMEGNRSQCSLWILAGLLAATGCSRVDSASDAPPADESADAADAADNATIDVADSPVEQASAVVADATAVDPGVSLRDANVATSLIARTFPIRDMFVKYFGALISPYHRGAGFVPSPEASQWVLDRVAWDGTDRIEVVFELLNIPMSDRDVPLQVDFDRVVYIHVRYCRGDELGVVPNDEFQIDGVGILELFLQCADRVKEYWEAECRFAEANKDAQSVYHLKENLLQNAERRGEWNVFPMDDDGVFFTEDPSQIRRPPWASE